MSAMVNKKTKKAKRQLSDLSHSELLEYVRTLRAERQDQRTQIEQYVQTQTELENQLTEAHTALEKLQTAFETLSEQYETAVENNAKIRGVLEADSDDDDKYEDGNFQRVLNRLDVIIHLMGGSAIQDSDIDDDDDLNERTVPVLTFPNRSTIREDFPLDPEDANADDDDDDDDDIVAAEVDDWQPDENEESSQVESVVDLSTNALEDESASEATNGSKEVAGINEEELTALVSAQVKATVDSFENYEDVILAAVRDGSMTKELALRTVIAQAYPSHVEMADVILASDTTRETVYGLMGL